MDLSSPPLLVPPSALNRFSKGPYSSDDSMPSSPTSNTSAAASPQISPRLEAPQASTQLDALLSVAFNQDHGCFACGTQTGFRIYNCDPFKETFRREFDGAGIAIVEMLFRCNILALVGGGKSPRYSPNKVMIWDDHLSRCIGELSFRTEVRAVRLRRDRIIVVLQFRIYVYNFADLKLLHQIETWSNTKGICALSPSPKTCVLACPGQRKGEVRVELYTSKKTRFIMAHDSSLACLSLSLDGSLLATASNKGTLVRIFNTADGTKLQELRRGVERAEIYSLVFHPNLRWLAVSSAKGTVHVFTIKPTTEEARSEAIANTSSASADGSALSPGKNNDSPLGSSSLSMSSPSANAGSSLSFMKGVLPKYFSSEWSFSQFRGLLAGEFLREAKPFIEDGVHPQLIIRAFRTAVNLVVKKVKELAVSIEGKSMVEKKNLLEKCAATTLSSKLVGGEKEFFSKIVVDAVTSLGADSRLSMIGIKKVQGGTMRDSFLVNGVAFKKTFSYAGFEQQPKKFDNPKILLLNLELELKSEKENAEVRLSDPTQYQTIVDAEWNIIYEKLDKCVKSGAKIVLSRLAIGDLGTQYFADRDIFCAGRVMEEDLQRVATATGASVQTTVNNVIPDVLGQCELFEERQVGNERFNIFTGCPGGETATIVLRGGADQFIEEAERSLHDAIMIVRRALKNSNVVAGGGAIDMELSRYLRQHARTIAGKSQLFINSYAKALEVIPRQLCDNAGFDATDVLNKLRQKHALASGEGALYGVDINSGGIIDTFSNFVWEPSVVKINALTAATEAACIVLSVDETIKNPKSEAAQGEAMGGRGMGRGMGGMRGGRGGRGMRRR